MYLYTPTKYLLAGCIIELLATLANQWASEANRWAKVKIGCRWFASVFAFPTQCALYVGIANQSSNWLGIYCCHLAVIFTRKQTHLHAFCVHVFRGCKLVGEHISRGSKLITCMQTVVQDHCWYFVFFFALKRVSRKLHMKAWLLFCCHPVLRKALSGRGAYCRRYIQGPNMDPLSCGSKIIWALGWARL